MKQLLTFSVVGMIMLFPIASHAQSIDQPNHGTQLDFKLGSMIPASNMFDIAGDLFKSSKNASLGKANRCFKQGDYACSCHQLLQLLQSDKLNGRKLRKAVELMHKAYPALLNYADRESAEIDSRMEVLRQDPAEIDRLSAEAMNKYMLYHTINNLNREIQLLDSDIRKAMPELKECEAEEQAAETEARQIRTGAAEHHKTLGMHYYEQAKENNDKRYYRQAHQSFSTAMGYDRNCGVDSLVTECKELATYVIEIPSVIDQTRYNLGNSLQQQAISQILEQFAGYPYVVFQEAGAGNRRMFSASSGSDYTLYIELHNAAIERTQPKAEHVQREKEVQEGEGESARTLKVRSGYTKYTKSQIAMVSGAYRIVTGSDQRLVHSGTFGGNASFENVWGSNPNTDRRALDSIDKYLLVQKEQALPDEKSQLLQASSQAVQNLVKDMNGFVREISE